jgi:hypothetical protein
MAVKIRNFISIPPSFCGVFVQPPEAILAEKAQMRQESRAQQTAVLAGKNAL